MSEPGHDAGRRRGGAQVIPRPAQWETGSTAPWDGREIPPRIDVAAVLAAVRRRPRTPPPPLADGARPSAVLVANPIDEAEQLDPAVHERVLDEALRAAGAAGVSGHDTTPFLLDYV